MRFQRKNSVNLAIFFQTLKITSLSAFFLNGFIFSSLNWFKFLKKNRHLVDRMKTVSKNKLSLSIISVSLKSVEGMENKEEFDYHDFFQLFHFLLLCQTSYNLLINATRSHSWNQLQDLQTLIDIPNFQHNVDIEKNLFVCQGQASKHFDNVSFFLQWKSNVSISKKNYTKTKKYQVPTKSSRLFLFVGLKL